METTKDPALAELELELELTGFIDHCRRTDADAIPASRPHLRDANYLFFSLESRWMEAKKKIGAARFFELINEPGRDKLTEEITKLTTGHTFQLPPPVSGARCGWSEEAAI